MNELPTEPDWKEFEKAVATFVAAMDPSAVVEHDARLPDRHHGGARQRDVWVEAKLFGHFPVTVLISCKRWGRKLDSGDIDAFNGELASSRAQIGVIYSYSGFSRPAILKGRALGISCCQLFQGQQPSIPSILTFTTYCCCPQINVRLGPDGAAEWDLNTWADLFNMPFQTSAGSYAVIDELVSCYHQAERAAVVDAGIEGSIPRGFEAEIVVPRCRDRAVPLRVVVTGQWKFYRAKLHAFEVNGSYEFTTGDFKGEIASPSVDRFSSEPGPGWERLMQPPEATANLAMLILYKGNAKEALLELLGPRRLTGAEPRTEG